jgi:putative hydrolase of HD superfamily
MVDLLEDSDTAQEIYDLWYEYETGISEEAKVVKDIDMLEMIIQAHEYEQSDGKNLQSFFDSTKDSFYHPFSRAIAEAVYIKRSGPGL